MFTYHADVWRLHVVVVSVVVVGMTILISHKPEYLEGLFLFPVMLCSLWRVSVAGYGMAPGSTSSLVCYSIPLPSLHGIAQRHWTHSEMSSAVSKWVCVFSPDSLNHICHNFGLSTVNEAHWIIHVAMWAFNQQVLWPWCVCSSYDAFVKQYIWQWVFCCRGYVIGSIQFYFFIYDDYMNITLWPHLWKSCWHCVNTLQWGHNRARWRHKSPASRLFTQLFIQAQIKENIKAPRHWPLCGEFTGDRWIPRLMGQ